MFVFCENDDDDIVVALFLLLSLFSSLIEMREAACTHVEAVTVQLPCYKYANASNPYRAIKR